MVLPKYFLLTARKILILPKSSKLGGAIAPPAPPAGTAMVITGCNTGIGFENALQMVKRGARVLMACRDTNKAEEAKAEVL